ncbi:MAG: adenylate cyclase [Betaproteobacteria bacterium]|jgi:adenylate cyclase|nr:adenylate cyclase [Betaproteobacteria bacterium]
MTMPRGNERSIVILDIDEKSLGEIGRWPWSRRLMADVVAKLFDRHGIAVLGFDVVFAERDPSSGIDALDALAQNELKQAGAFQQAYRELRPRLDNDALFATAIKGRPVVLGYYFNSEEKAVRANALPEPVLPKGAFAGRDVSFYRWAGYTGNLQVYQQNAAGAGHFNPAPDDDGVSRRVPMLLEFDGAYYEPLSLAVLRAFIARQTGAPAEVQPGYPEGYNTLEWLQVGPYAIPVDDKATALIPFRGRKGAFEYVSLADVVKDRIAPGALKGRIALLGTTAPGLLDLRATPVEASFPGVEIHANLIAGMMDGGIRQTPKYALGADIVTLALAGVALALVIPLLSAAWATAAAAVGLIFVAGVNVVFWQNGVVLPLAGGVLMVAALYTMNMAYGYFVESRSKRQLAGRFGEYVPPELVDRMARDPGKYGMEPKDAELTILFCDVRDFTSITESLKAGELREFINEYLTTMSAIIRGRHRGTLDKYIGDAIMAFWGAPVEDPDHARNAVLAALDMQKECAALNQRFAARGWPTLKIGIGIESGMVRVGDMGSQIRRAYTAMGDAVNVASRLEGRTKYYGIDILVGEAVRGLAKDLMFREVDRIKVKGKERGLTVFEPLGPMSVLAPERQEELRLWTQTLRAYRAQQWDHADVNLINLQRENPQNALYKSFSGIVADRRRNPPPQDWDGVTVFAEK